MKELLGDKSLLPQTDIMLKRSDLPTTSSFSYISLSSLLSSSTDASSFVSLSNKFITSVLRYRFNSPAVLDLLYLFLQLQINIKERKEVKKELEITKSTIFGEEEEKEEGEEKGVKKEEEGELEEEEIVVPDGLLTPSSVYDLVLSHSQFASVILPTYNPSTSTFVPASSLSSTSSTLQLHLLQLLYFLLSSSSSTASTPFTLAKINSLLLLLSSSYSGTYSLSDLTLKRLFDLCEWKLLQESNSELKGKRMKQKILLKFKLERQIINYRRKFGYAGQNELLTKINKQKEGNSSEADGSNSMLFSDIIQLDDEGLWIYKNYNFNMLLNGPIVGENAVRQSEIETTLAFEKQIGGATEADAAQIATASSSSFSASSSSNSYLSRLSSFYDPSFLLPFLHHFLSSTAFDCRKLIECGLLSYLLLSFSSPLLPIRKYAYECMSKIYNQIETTSEQEEKEMEKIKGKMQEQEEKEEEGEDKDAKERRKQKKKALANYHDLRRARTASLHTFKEQAQLTLLLSVFKNSITVKHQHLPSLHCFFLSRITPLLLQPEHKLYALINKFLIQRPAFDFTDVPMFYSLFNSNHSTDYKYYRSWILRWIIQGIQTKEDVEILKRRHVMNVIEAFHDARTADRYTRMMVLQLMERVSSVKGNGKAEGWKREEAASFNWIRAVLATPEMGIGTMEPVLKLVRTMLKQVKDQLVKASSKQGEDKEIEDEEEKEEDEEENKAMKIEEEEEKEVVVEEDGDANMKGVADTEEELGMAKRQRRIARQRVVLASDCQLILHTLAQKLEHFLSSRNSFDDLVSSTNLSSSNAESPIDILLDVMHSLLTTSQLASHLSSSSLSSSSTVFSASSHSLPFSFTFLHHLIDLPSRVPVSDNSKKAVWNMVVQTKVGGEDNKIETKSNPLLPSTFVNTKNANNCISSSYGLSSIHSLIGWSLSQLSSSSASQLHSWFRWFLSLPVSSSLSSSQRFSLSCQLIRLFSSLSDSVNEVIGITVAKDLNQVLYVLLFEAAKREGEEDKKQQKRKENVREVWSKLKKEEEGERKLAVQMTNLFLQDELYRQIQLHHPSAESDASTVSHFSEVVASNNNVNSLLKRLL